MPSATTGSSPARILRTDAAAARSLGRSVWVYGLVPEAAAVDKIFSVVIGGFDICVVCTSRTEEHSELKLILCSSPPSLQDAGLAMRALLSGLPAMAAAIKLSVVPPAFKPMPPPIRSTQPGTWAHDTMSRRVIVEILDRIVYAHNANLDNFNTWKPALDELRGEIAAAVALKPLVDDGGPDIAAWNDLLARESGETWLSAPWLLAEFYLYRRVAAATGWFASGIDVFAHAKTTGLEAALGSLETLAQRARASVDDPSELKLFLYASLWGNRMDLSLWPGATNVAGQGQFEAVLASGQAQMLADDAALVAGHLSSKSNAVVDLILDNAGFELCSDLLLAHHLLASGVASRVRLRCKHHPTFVSDALEVDVDAHIRACAAASPGLASLAEAWQTYRDDGSLLCCSEPYWAMPYALWEMPDDLRRELAQTSDLVIVKGDANYRRALGDRPWPLSAPFDQVCSYFPAPLLCLRTLKAELGCGMDPAKVRAAQQADQHWLTNGKWGVLQFVLPRAS